MSETAKIQTKGNEDVSGYAGDIRHPKKRAYLIAYMRCGSLSGAAIAAGIDRDNHYLWLRKDPEYARAFAAAQLVARDLLEEEARRRAVEGVQRVKFYAGAPVMVDGKPHVEHEYSDTLLIFLMKGQFPEKYREAPAVIQQVRVEQRNETSVKVASPAEFDAACPDMVAVVEGGEG